MDDNSQLWEQTCSRYKPYCTQGSHFLLMQDTNSKIKEDKSFDNFHGHIGHSEQSYI